jgi:RNA polymerase sigma-70 factor (ECF subfamily)
LLGRHVNGDPDAFGALFARHRDRLWAVAVRTIGDPDEAADALQDAMISAFRQAAGFRGDSAVTTWLHRIVVNACLDRMRRRAVRPAATGLDEATLDSFAASSRWPASGPGGTDAAETSLEVDAALRHLPPEQRAALVLVDMLGYPVADAAAVLGVSTGTVKSRCARGRARLLPLLAHLRGQATHVPSPARPSTGPGSADRDAARAASPGLDPPSAAPATPNVSGAAPPTEAADPMPGNRRPPRRVSPAQGGGEHRP